MYLISIIFNMIIVSAITTKTATEEATLIKKSVSCKFCQGTMMLLERKTIVRDDNVIMNDSIKGLYCMFNDEYDWWNNKKTSF